jgi:hypothetical protein
VYATLNTANLLGCQIGALGGALLLLLLAGQPDRLLVLGALFVPGEGVGALSAWHAAAGEAVSYAAQVALPAVSGLEAIGPLLPVGPCRELPAAQRIQHLSAGAVDLRVVGPRVVQHLGLVDGAGAGALGCLLGPIAGSGLL